MVSTRDGASLVSTRALLVCLFYARAGGKWSYAIPRDKIAVVITVSWVRIADLNPDRHFLLVGLWASM